MATVTTKLQINANEFIEINVTYRGSVLSIRSAGEVLSAQLSNNHLDDLIQALVLARDSIKRRERK